MDYFDGKTALITGASRGVGYALARELATRGARVVISARGEKRLHDSLEKLRKITPDIVAVAGDVGAWEDAEKMVFAAVDNFGGIDILVNNAGVSMRGNFSELTPEVCQQVVQTNLLGCMFPSLAAVEHISKVGGHIVFISSIAGLFGLPGASAYCASKGALTGLCESMRIELHQFGVHVGVVHLGFTEHDPEKRILAADGSQVLPDRPAHNTQEQAAKAIVGMMQKRKRRLVMTPPGKLGGLAYRLSPGLVEKAIVTAKSSSWAIFKDFE
jgi:dehydrogenase/reductase SDR family member 7B